MGYLFGFERVSHFFVLKGGLKSRLKNTWVSCIRIFSLGSFVFHKQVVELGLIFNSDNGLRLLLDHLSRLLHGRLRRRHHLHRLHWLHRFIHLHWLLLHWQLPHRRLHHHRLRHLRLPHLHWLSHRWLHHLHWLLLHRRLTHLRLPHLCRCHDLGLLVLHVLLLWNNDLLRISLRLFLISVINRLCNRYCPIYHLEDLRLPVERCLNQLRLFDLDRLWLSHNLDRPGATLAFTPCVPSVMLNVDFQLVFDTDDFA